MRKRFVGQNEADSAAEAAAWMQGNGADARSVELVTAAIMGTVPSWDAQNMTVEQPNVTAGNVMDPHLRSPPAGQPEAQRRAPIPHRVAPHS